MRIFKFLILSSFSCTIALSIFNNFFCSASRLAPDIEKINEVRIIELSPDSLKLYINLEVENKNPFKIDVEKVSIDIFEGNDFIGNASHEEQISMPSRSSRDIEFNAVFKPEKIFEILSKNVKTVKLKLVGRVMANVSFVSMPVELNMDYDLDLENNLFRMLENDVREQKIITIGRAFLKEIGFNESTVSIDFTFKNPYGIKYTVKSYPSKIFINGNYAGDGDLAEPLNVMESETESGNFEFDLNYLKTAISLLGSIFSRELSYETQGTLSIEISGYHIQFPYSFNGVLIKI